ncbi:MAG: hypothetical protein Q8859_10920 [Bacteroidota bacterium]|nr:hypothetical protein [Bacteroidota bacterium]
MEESNNVKSTGSGWKKSKNFIYWILGGIIIVFLAISYMPTQRGGFHLFAEPVQTYWNDVKNNMLRNHDVEEIEVVNKKTIHIYLKKSSYQKYADRFPGGISSPSKGGPQFSFEIASLDVFNSELDKKLSEF